MSPQFNAKPAGLIRRIGSLVYDWLLVIALWFVETAMLLPLTHGQALPMHGPWHGAYQAVLALTALGFFVFFWRRNGQTLGMRAWRLRLVDESGRTPPLSKLLYRATWAVPSWGLAGLGMLAMYLDPQRRALQDRMSGTRLVTENPG
ncbi:MAG: RDD family protein [Pseudomonadota bacterium]